MEHGAIAGPEWGFSLCVEMEQAPRCVSLGKKHERGVQISRLFNI